MLTKKKDGRYQIVEKLGGGSHALVWSAKDTETSETVAIKQVIGQPGIFMASDPLSMKPLDNFTTELAKRTLREIKILDHFNDVFKQYSNIVSLKDVFIDQEEGLYSVCLVMDQMKCDLHQLITSPVKFSQNHIILFTYQILRGLNVIHSAKVIHRDLKPSNILINEDLQIKLCDFGTGRGNQSGPQSLRQTILREVATTYYRAPEGLLDQTYSTTVDIWSVGCILGELILRRPLFQLEEDGRTEDRQLLTNILKILGSPPKDVWASFSNTKMKTQVSSEEYPAKTALEILPQAKDLFSDMRDNILSLFLELLQFDHKTRITAPKALQHPTFQLLHDTKDEPTTKEFDDPEKKESKGLGSSEKINWHKLLRKEVKGWNAL